MHWCLVGDGGDVSIDCTSYSCVNNGSATRDKRDEEDEDQMKDKDTTHLENWSLQSVSRSILF